MCIVLQISMKGDFVFIGEIRESVSEEIIFYLRKKRCVRWTKPTSKLGVEAGAQAGEPPGLRWG